jgi:hypothetical protein
MRDKEDEGGARLPEILAGGAIVMPQCSHSGMVGQSRGNSCDGTTRGRYGGCSKALWIALYEKTKLGSEKEESCQRGLCYIHARRAPRMMLL